MERKTVLVTGGAKGLGAGIAERFARAGYALVLVGRDLEALERAQAKLGAGTSVAGLACDLGERSSILDLAGKLEDRTLKVDILVNNAGVAPVSKFEQTDALDWERTMKVNALGPAWLTAQLLPGMKARGFGRIVNIASTAALQGGRQISAYAASKHALLGWSRSLAMELQGSGVTLNTLCPGYIDTPIFDRAMQRVLSKCGGDLAQAKAALLKSVGQTRLLEVQEVAQRVLALVESQEAPNAVEECLCP